MSTPIIDVRDLNDTTILSMVKTENADNCNVDCGLAIKCVILPTSRDLGVIYIIKIKFIFNIIFNLLYNIN